ncbi:MAG: apolipoprotein N-acyltransferase [bacterium]|nr:apolipoprotein N-acyltransferase [bacterium]
MKYRQTALATTTGLVLALAFNTPLGWPLIFFALIPLFKLIGEFRHEENQKKLFLLTFLAGFIFFGITSIWAFSLLPLTWAGIESKMVSFALVFYIWVVSNAVAALAPAFFAYSFSYLRRHAHLARGNTFNLLLAPALWIIFEYLRAFAISLLWAGPGSLIGAHWTIGFLGYALVKVPPLLSLAGLGGVYLLSFVVVYLNYILYQLFSKSLGWRQALALASIPFVIGTLALVLNRPSEIEQKFKLAIITTQEPSFLHITQKEMLASLEKFKTLLWEAKDNYDPDIIILPEDARLLRKMEIAKEQNYLTKNFGDRERLIIESSRVTEPTGEVKSKFFFINTKDGTVAISEKFFLVPNGEYLPYITQVIASIMNDESLAKFKEERNYHRGTVARVASFRGVKIGALFCSEIITNILYQKLTNQGANILINAASQSLFHGSYLLYNQTVNMGQVRAVENNRYFIQASNFVPSYVVSNTGRVVARSAWGETSVLGATVPAITHNTPYSKLGDWILLLSLIIVILGLPKRRGGIN